MAPRGGGDSGAAVASTSASAKGKGKLRQSAADEAMPDAAPSHTQEEVLAWRTAQIDTRQAELAQIVDSHDDHVRELFHLDRFVTLIGFDPATAKQDKSDVFTTFQHNYDLWTHATPESTESGGGRRATRRAATERKVGAGVAPPTPSASTSAATPGSRAGAGHAHGKVDAKGKGKATAAPSSVGKGAADESDGESVVVRKGSVKGKGKGRRSVPAPAPPPAPPAASAKAATPPPSRAKGKRHSLAVSTLEPSPPPPAKRIKLAHDPNLPPVYSHPQQVPRAPMHNRSLAALLSSYIVLDDEDHALPLPPHISLSDRAEQEASVFSRVHAFTSSGRTLGNPDRRPSTEAKRAKKDHQDHLVDQVIYFSKLLHDERKSHIYMGRKISKMVLGHFASLRGKEDRDQRELEKAQKALAKWTAREVRKKWKMAFNVVKARRKAEQKAERDRIGKEQLNAMLDKSTTMLQAQAVEREANEDSESEAESESSDEEEEEGVDATPDATPDVESESAAPSPIPRRRLQRAHSGLSSAPADSPAPSDPGPVEESADPDLDLDDDVFVAPEDAARANEDETWEAEMEAEASDDSDGSEIDGLVEDADLPIEDLRAKYAAMDAAAAAAQDGTPSDDDGDNDANGDTTMADAPDLESQSLSPPPPPANGVPASPPHQNGATPGLTAEEAEAEAMSEFGSDDGDEARANEDEEMEKEMEDEASDAGSSDSEIDDLVQDADLTLDELRAKYYGAPDPTSDDSPENGSEPVEEESLPIVVEEEVEEKAEEKEVDVVATNGHAASASSPAAEDSDAMEEEEQEVEASEEESAGDEEEEEDTSTAVAHLRPPFLLRGSLRPYQQAGLEWLASLYATGVNGILADEMGLGKTIQTISLLAHLACDKGQWGPHLVVVPTSVMLNWEMEFKKFLPGFKILTYYGTTKERKEKRRGWNTENAFHVCVTSYQLVLADQHMFRRKPWHYMILDEAHHIKNFRSQRWQTLLGFNARHRLLLTGTPLQNNLMELWSLLYFLMPQGLTGEGGKGPFADHADFQAWFSNPMEKAIENGESMDEETKATVAKLHTVLRPYLLRRLKAEVETQMPGKTESIILCRLSKRQRFLYDDFMSRSQTRETLGSGHFLSIINCLMQLRKVCNHPDLFEVRPIVTSFAMRTSVPSKYETTELLVRKRLLDDAPLATIDWSSLTLVRPHLELESSATASRSRVRLDAAPALRTMHPLPPGFDLAHEPPRDTRTLAGWRTHHTWSEHRAGVERTASLAATNSRRCATSVPFFGHELLHMLSEPSREHTLLPVDVARNPRSTLASSSVLPTLVKSLVTRGHEADELVAHFGFVTPKVKALDMARHALGNLPLETVQRVEDEAPVEILQRASAKLSVAFPDRSLLQYDCGKLQKLDELLRECKAGGHRVLIFTQMTKVLDILEIFLSFHGHRYLRLDGSTKIEQRQIITERFNSNDRILAFISSTRSGGLGINLQGADTVIFYDSDWNPALDRQCQDRAHRIGQTREVRIWRFVTEHSIEENMLKKANQKRRLDEMVIAEGDFTTDYLQKLDWRDYLDDSQIKELGIDEGDLAPGAGESAAEVRQALAAAEDEEDAAAAKAAEGELQVDQSDFSEAAPLPKADVVGPTGSGAPTPTPTGGPSGEGTATPMEVELPEEEEGEVDPLAGTVDGYIVRFVTENWELFDV